MFSDPWIMAGSGAMVVIIVGAFLFRTYNRIKSRAENSSKKTSA